MGNENLQNVHSQEGVRVFVKARGVSPMLLKKEEKKYSTSAPQKGDTKEKDQTMKTIPSIKNNDVKQRFIDMVGQYRLKNKQDVVKWGPQSEAIAHKRKISKLNAINLKQLLCSIFAAILLGSVMGFSILKLFFSDNILPSRSIDSHLSPSPSLIKNKDK